MEFRGELEAEINTLQLLSCRKLKVQGSVFFLLPPPVFQRSEVLVVAGGGSFARGRLGVRAGVKSKCVIVTELMKESRGGQCADRTLGCMIHRTRTLRTPPPPPRPAPEIPTVSSRYGTHTEAMANHLTSPLVWATPTIWG